jgi:hypothetical protein
LIQGMHREAEHPSHEKEFFIFWPINVEISFNTKTRLQVMTWSLVFVLMLISIFIDQNPLCMFYFSVHSPWEKNLKSFPFKVVLSWKQCSCDVIIERVNSDWTRFEVLAFWSRSSASPQTRKNGADFKLGFDILHTYSLFIRKQLTVCSKFWRSERKLFNLFYK